MSVESPTIDQLGPEQSNAQAEGGKRGLLVGRAFYFVLMFAIASFVSFINLYYESLGLSGTQLGMIGAATALLGLFAMPFLSAIADMRQWHKQMLIAFVLASGFYSLLYLGISGFWGALLVSLLYTFLRTPIMPILDGSIVAMVRRTGAAYGRQRLWGSIGFAAGAIVMARLLERAGFSSIFWVQFVGYGVLLTILSILLPVERSTGAVNYGAGLRILLKLPHYRGLVVLMIGLGVIGSVNSSYSGIYILDIGGSAGIVGLLFMLGALVEVPAMLSGDLLSSRIGMRRTMIIAGVGQAAAVALAAFAWGPWSFVTCMVIMSAFGGLVWATLAPLVLQDAPPHMSATALGIIYMAFGSIGFAIGTLMGGIILDVAGGGFHFLAAAALMLLGTLYYTHSTRA